MEAISFTLEALDDLKFWQKSGNIIVLKRIRQLLKAIETDPFTGIGKPEALKHNLSGYWSRRINQEHRIVYLVQDNLITVHSLRYQIPSINFYFPFTTSHLQLPSNILYLQHYILNTVWFIQKRREIRLCNPLATHLKC